MNWWIFKCNDMHRKHTVVNGDWRHHFFFRKPYKTQQWGSTQHGKYGSQMEQLEPEDMVIAYQSDLNEFIGLARVVGLKKRQGHKDVYLEPIEEFAPGEKVRLLKERYKAIAEIDALKKTGVIRTVYEVSQSEADKILAVMGAVYRRRTKVPDSLDKNVQDEMEFVEGEQRTVKSTVRDAKLSVEAKRKWGLKCCCCGFDFGDFYGEKAKGFIIVHHLKTFQGKRRKAGVDDVRVVCSNCHSVIHLTKHPEPVDSLKKSIAKSWLPWSRKGIRRKS